MSGPSVFVVAIDVATQQRDAAQGSLALIERNQLFAQGQLDQLTSYANETEGRWIASAQISASPELLRHHYQFMARLRNAIDLQLSVLQGFRDQIREGQQLVLQKQIRLRRLEMMLDKKQAELEAKQARRDRIQMDEFAASQHSRKHLQMSSGETL